MTPITITDAIRKTFFDRIYYCVSGCWIWTGHRNKHGYGVLCISHGKLMLSHRASYMIYKGEINDLDVLHSCDNPFCVNPDHLSLGTQTENHRDMCKKKRQAAGEKIGQSKLDTLQVTAIRELRKHGIRQNELARYFKVHQSLISYIERGKLWAHITVFLFFTSLTLSAQTVLQNAILDTMIFEIRKGRQCEIVMTAQAHEIESLGKELVHVNTALRLSRRETVTLTGLIENAAKDKIADQQQFALDLKKEKKKTGGWRKAFFIFVIAVGIKEGLNALD